MSRRGFTLIELLVVVAVIGILSSLLLPTLARSKAQAQGASCQNNIRQLALATLMYTDDNSGYFPYNMAGGEVHTNINWAGDVLDWESSPDNTNTAELTGAALGPYGGQSSDIFHCPSDNVLSAIQRSLGWVNRARSYSMNASVGNAGEITSSGVNTNNPWYIQFFKYASVPQPSQIFIFIEEHPDTITDGYFINKAYSAEWERMPGSYHLRGANVSFADGHAELHPWKDLWTTPVDAPDAASAVVWTNIPPAQQADFKWVINHMTVPLK